MQGTLRFVRLLTMVVWVGGLVFFAFVLAPTAFHVLPSVRLAGLVVGGSLRSLHVLGMGCLVVFCVATAATGLRSRSSRMQIVLAGVMGLMTVYLQGSVLPTMEADRVKAGGDIDAVAKEDPTRMDFDRLHVRSEREEGLVLLAGLGILGSMAFETPETRATAG